MHSKKNERISVSKVEALLKTARHGTKSSSGHVQHKKKDGTIKLTSRSKKVCPICGSVTRVLSTHLQRVHKFKRDSDRYKDAIQRRRRYLGKKKELKRVEKSLQMKKTKPPSDETRPPPPDKMLSKLRPLQILIEKAEMSEGSSDEFPEVIPPTPPRAPSAEVEQRATEQTNSDDPCPHFPEVHQLTEDQTDSDEDLQQRFQFVDGLERLITSFLEGALWRLPKCFNMMLVSSSDQFILTVRTVRLHDLPNPVSFSQMEFHEVMVPARRCFYAGYIGDGQLLFAPFFLELGQPKA